jgi:hypothetical protein
MKTRFRIARDRGNDQGDGHGGEQSRRQDYSVNPMPLWSPRWHVSAGAPPTKNPADHSPRKGTACCARCSIADQRRTSAINPWIPTVVSPTTKNLCEFTQFPVISNRFWLKNRSYRKQKTKPCLTGARTAFSDSRFSRDFRANFAPAVPHRNCFPVAPTATHP